MNSLLTPEKVEKIQKEANAVLNMQENMSDPFKRVSAIAIKNGIEILEADLFDISGALRREGKVWKIYVNKQDSKQRQLFTIAHELGHYFIHKDDQDEFVDGQFIARNETQKYLEQELEANEFAGNLIMPEEAVRRCIPDTISRDTIHAMAQQFGVSTMAMETRLRNLGYDTKRCNTEQQAA
ncbi:MAG: ImmA/IrrE family metallo-endopeptidase [Candidatus Peribacteraceae bacterium]|nr:ImmA/IrrE family metallo-endopeptidase [Candidatus Peribacteraceae bacterium]